MTTDQQAVRVLESLSRFSVAVAIAFVTWFILGQKPNCPSCGSALDTPQTYTRAQVIGEILDKD